MKAITVDEYKNMLKKSKREELEVKFMSILRMLARFGYVPDYVREFKFDPDRNWRVDFYFDELKLAVEIEGGKWVRGRHQRPMGFEDDCEKYNALTLADIRLLRFTGDMLIDNSAAKTMCKLLSIDWELI